MPIRFCLVPVCRAVRKKDMKSSWPLSYTFRWRWETWGLQNPSRRQVDKWCRNAVRRPTHSHRCAPVQHPPLSSDDWFCFLSPYLPQIYQLQEFGRLWCQRFLLKCCALDTYVCWGFWLWKYLKTLNVGSSQFPFWGSGINKFQEDINNELGGSMNFVFGKICRPSLQIPVAKHSFKRGWGFPLIFLTIVLAWVALLGFCLLQGY